MNLLSSQTGAQQHQARKTGFFSSRDPIKDLLVFHGPHHSLRKMFNFDLQLGAIVLPKTTHREYLIENLSF